MSDKAADRLPTWQFALLRACIGILSAATAAAIDLLIFHMPRTGPFGIHYWAMSGVFLTIFFTGFSLPGRHIRMHRRWQ